MSDFVAFGFLPCGRGLRAVVILSRVPPSFFFCRIPLFVLDVSAVFVLCVRAKVWGKRIFFWAPPLYVCNFPLGDKILLVLARAGLAMTNPGWILTSGTSKYRKVASLRTGCRVFQTLIALKLGGHHCRKGWIWNFLVDIFHWTCFLAFAPS
ncbi:unnamed protein product [Ectocarpus fasciculatus]